MQHRLNKFNCILALAVAVVCLVSGCQTSGRPKGPVTILRLHLEVSQTDADLSGLALIGRTDPIPIYVEKSPFIDERDVASAAIVDEDGTFSLRLEFTRRGRWLLEQYSASNPGRRCAIFCQFGNRKTRVSRWLGAPMFTRRIADGVLVFVPDASRAEAEQIVTGLNNLARQTAKERGPLD